MNQRSTKKLSIIVPVYNEKKTLPIILERIYRANTPGYQKEVIVIDDGSIDGSDVLLTGLKKQYGFIRHRHKKNRGKGQAIRTGLKLASGEIVLIQDADLEYNPNDWQSLLDRLNDPAIKAVFGSRNIKPQRRGYAHCILGVKILTQVINLLYRAQLTDSYTCYKCLKREVLADLNLTADGFEIEAEITTKLLKKGYAIAEIPIHYAPRKFKEGKKIGWKDGLLGLWEIIKNR